MKPALLRVASTLTVLAAVLTTLVSAQTPPPANAPAGTAIIRGRVLRADGRALARVQIRLRGSDRQRLATTDAAGRYELTGLASDSYTLSASREGFITLEFGQQKPFERGKPIRLGTNETLEKIDLVLPAARAITGRVVDENGEPVEGATVQVLQVRFGAGRRRLAQVMAGGGVTDDLGRYRAYGLQPGEYAIAAIVGNRPGSAGVPGYAPTFFPGSLSVADAQFVTLGLVEDLAGIDVRLTKVRTARVSGVALDASGAPLRGGLMLNQSERSGSVVAMPMTAQPGPDGRFDIANVPPGNYVLQAIKPTLAPPRLIEGEFASQFVAVNGQDVPGLIVQTSLGSTVSGRVTLDGEAAAMKPTDVALSPFPADFDQAPLIGSGYAATIHDDWTFEMGGLSGPRLFRLLRSPAEWSVKAVRVNGIDVTDTPQPFGTKEQSLTDVEVVLTTRAGELSGAVTDARGQPAPEYTALVFATDRRRWEGNRSRFLSFARPGQDGGFVARGLPPGEYFAAAVDWMQGNEGAGEWQDPMFLESLSTRATKVTLTEGQKQSISLKLLVR